MNSFRQFNIQPLEDEDHDFIVFINSHISPIEIMHDLYSELEQLCDKNCKIIFDLLLYRGNYNQRYFSMDFDRCNLVKGSLEEIIITKKHNVRKISARYFKDNNELLDNSMLTDIQRNMIRKGLVI